MIKNTLCFLSLFTFITFSLTLTPNAIFAQSGSNPKIRQQTFDKVWQTINEKYFDANFNGVNWKAVRGKYAPRLPTVKNDEELYELLNEMMSELKVSHLEIVTPDDLAKAKNPPVTTGIGLRELDNQAVVTRVFENSPAAKAGVKTGYAVTKVDGESINNLAEAKRKISGPANTFVKIEFADETDSPREFNLERAPLVQADKGKLGDIAFHALFDSKTFDENIGYVRFSNFAEFLSHKIVSAIESMRQTKGIIIDLRGNGGGEDSLGIDIASIFFAEKTQLMITKTRQGDNFDYHTKPNKNPYRGAVVILTDEQSGSASEQFAAGMQEINRAFVIGKRTRGEDLDADLKLLPTKAYLLYAYGEPRTPKGVIIEGRGVIPNQEVTLTRKELLKGKDAQLEAAIEYFKRLK
jgi:carboxyl-terminal processing protease